MRVVCGIYGQGRQNTYNLSGFVYRTNNFRTRPKFALTYTLFCHLMPCPLTGIVLQSDKERDCFQILTDE